MEWLDEVNIVLQKHGLNLSTAVDLTNSLDEFVGYLEPPFEVLEKRQRNEGLIRANRVSALDPIKRNTAG